MKRSLGSSRRAAIAALPRLVLRRAFSEKMFVGLRLIGLTIAVAVSAGVFIYLDALGQSALSQSLSGHRQQDLNVAVRARNDSISQDTHRGLVMAVADTRSGELAKVLVPPTMAAKSATLVFDQDLVPWKNARTFLSHVDGVAEAATLLDGAWPGTANSSEPIETAISAEDAIYLGIGIGQIVHLNSPTSEDIQVTARVSGIFSRDDPNAPQWDALDNGLGADSAAFRFAPFIVSEPTLIDAVANHMPDTEVRYYWVFETEVDRIHSRDAEQILADLESQEAVLKQELQGFQRISFLDDALASFLTNSEISRGLMMSVGAVIALSSLAFAALVASQARDIRFSESGMARARGATTPQEIALMTGETLLIAAISLIAGVAIALVGVSFAGRLPMLHELTGGEFLPASLSAQSVGAAVAAAVIGLGALLLPSLRRNASTTEVLASRLARPPQRNAAQRYYLDVVLLCIGVAALWQLSQEDLYISSSALGEGFSNRLALAMPAATAAGGAIVLLRFLPFFLGGIAEVLTRLPSMFRLSPAIPLALWSLARNPRSSMGLMLLIMLAATIAVLLSILSPSITQYAVDDARYRVGSDIRISGMIVRNRSNLHRVIEQMRTQFGFATMAPVARAAGTVSAPSGNEPVTALGIDTGEFPSAVWWRSDLATDSPDELALLVKSRDTDGYPLPADAVWLTALVKPDTQRTDTGLVARIRDESGLYHSVSIGNLEPRSLTVGTPYVCEQPEPLEDEESFEPPNWCRIGIPLTPLRRDTSENEQLRLEFIGISRRPIEDAPQPTTGSVRIKDISTANAAGELSLLTDFDDVVNQRTSGAGFGDLGARIDPFSETPGEGAVLTWSQPRFGQLKGVRVGTSDDALRVVGSNWFKDELGLEVGDTTRLFLGNRSTTVEFVGFTHFFPTFPSASSTYLIADLREIQRIMSIDQTRGADATNELWISAPGASADSLSNIENLLSINNLTARLMQHAGSEVTRTRSDALTAAGWNGYLGFGFIAVTTVSILAFIVTGWTTYRLRRLELAVLKSMGMSMRQMLLMIGLEQIVIASISLIVGAGIGLVLSAVLLPYLAGKDASTLAPPMVAVIGTQMLGILLGVVAAALIASVTWIFLWVRGQHTTTVIRAGGAGA